MNETDQPKPFYRRREFQGTLSKAGKNIEDLHFIVDYAENKPDKIKATIVGNRTDSDRISALMRQGAPYSEIRSKAYEGCYEIIRSSRARIKQAQNRHWPNEYGDRMVGKICDIELQELKIDISVDNKDRDERGICFYLAGPRSFWPLHWSQARSYTGAVDIEIDPLQIDIPNPIQAKIELSPNFLYSPIRLEDGKEAEATDYVLIIEIKTDLSIEDLSDSDFINSAIQIADDLTLLASFASRKHIKWFQYDYYSPKRIRHFVRYISESFVDDVYFGDLLIMPGEAKEFIQSSIINLQNLREKKIDLFLPIINVLNGHESQYLEQQFILYFMSLEKLKDMYAIDRDINSNFSNNSEKNKILHSVRKLIRDQLPDAKSQPIVDKVNELNRPSIWSLVDSLLSDQSVEWKDLYPNDVAKPSFFNTRNALVHSANEIDGKLLFYETYRVQTIVERLLLKLLGWKNIYRAGSFHTDSLAKGPGGN